MKIEITLLVCTLIYGIIHYSVYLRERSKARARLYRISHLLSLSKGHENAPQLYGEAYTISQRYGIIPEDFGYDDYEQLRIETILALKRYIETITDLYEEEELNNRDLQKEIDDKKASHEAIMEYALVMNALNHLFQKIKSSREKLDLFTLTSQFVS